MTERTCSIDGCDRQQWARGWCSTHYKRWRERGTTDDPPPRPPRPKCAVEGCDRTSEKRGWCAAHYYRWRTKGDPGPAKFKRRNVPIVDGRKQCGICDEWLPLDGFGPMKQGVGGRRGTCRECTSAYHREYRERNPDYWREWSRSNADRINTYVQSRRAWRLGRPHEDIDRAVVFDRDDYTCQICDGPLDMEAGRHAPWSATLDHIVPLSKGGTHTYDNVQAAHLRCNVIKGDRVA